MYCSIQSIVDIMTTTAHLLSAAIKSPLHCLSGRQAVLLNCAIEAIFDTFCDIWPLNYSQHIVCFSCGK